MIEPASFAVFVAAALALLVTPGPAVLYVVTRSVEGGRLAGFVSCLGISAGGLFHVLAAALGVSAVLASSALAFTVLKLAGAAYLAYLGVRRLAAPVSAGIAPLEAGARPLRRLFLDGVVVNVFNPKAALFFLAFLPQFVAPERGPVALQMLALGLSFELLGFCTDSLYALTAGTASRVLRGHAGFARAERYLTGTTYLALGLAAALETSR